MRLLTNSGVAAGDSIPFNNEPNGERIIMVWGTVTNVNVEISPDNGTTWIAVKNLTAAGMFLVPLGGSSGYMIRGNVAVGAGVYLDLI